MEKCREKDGVPPQLLDLNVGERDWEDEEEQRARGCTEERKLELRLGPPGQDWMMMMMKKKNNTQKASGPGDDSILSLGCFSNMKNKTGDSNPNGWFSSSSLSSSQRLATVAKESSQPCNTSGSTGGAEMTMKKKAFSPPAPPEKTAVVPPNSSQKRTAPAPVVGWPPIRSFRKNLASTSSSKLASYSPDATPSKPPIKEPTPSSQKGLFVKINMDGVPIGRKVDLKAHDSYEKLSGAVDELFRGLLAAQRDSPSNGAMQKKQEGHKAITGLLDGSGEYTLVYEDNEGDRMLVGDVPWHMFVSTVRRLRVLRSSELSKLCSGTRQGKISSR